MTTAGRRVAGGAAAARTAYGGLAWGVVVASLLGQTPDVAAQDVKGFAKGTLKGGGKAAGAPRPGAVALRSAPPQTVKLTLPFAGIWGVIQGVSSDKTHVGYAAYAIDFVPAENLARAVPEAQRRRLVDFPCFGQAVLAAADGVVVWARDASPDSPPGREVRREPGNFVIIEHAPGEFTELRHLRSRSVRVKVGDRVARGQPVAECGNSGNARTPHLHIGLLGSADPIATRPMRFSEYQVLQADGTWKNGDGVPREGQILRTTGTEAFTPSDSSGGRLRRERPTR